MEHCILSLGHVTGAILCFLVHGPVVSLKSTHFIFFPSILCNSVLLLARFQIRWLKNPARTAAVELLKGVALLYLMWWYAILSANCWGTDWTKDVIASHVPQPWRLESLVVTSKDPVSIEARPYHPSGPCSTIFSTHHHQLISIFFCCSVGRCWLCLAVPGSKWMYLIYLFVQRITMAPQNRFDFFFCTAHTLHAGWLLLMWPWFVFHAFAGRRHVCGENWHPHCRQEQRVHNAGYRR